MKLKYLKSSNPWIESKKKCRDSLSTSMISFQSAGASKISHLGNSSPSLSGPPFSDPNRLAPEDAFYANSPPRQQREEVYSRSISSKINIGNESARFRPNKDRGRSRSRRGKGGWKKLLWVKQDCMYLLDTQPDQSTFSDVECRS